MTTNLYPVDSATRTCCDGIGDHTPDCRDSADVAAPADAVHCGDWADLDDDGQLQRHFTGTRHHDNVTIIGLQHADGQVERCVSVPVDPRNEVITPTQARTLAGALLAAAVEADQLDTIR